jgi:putative ABC transport system permease protein
MEGWLQDFRQAFRRMINAPGPSSVIILTLGLGIGASTATFSLFEQVLLRPLPFPEAERIVSLWETHPNNIERVRASLPNFLDWARQGHETFEALAAFQDRLGFNLNEAGGPPERVTGTAVSSAFFSVLGIQAMRGRTLLPDEGKNGEDVAVLSHGLWIRRFGGEPDVVGRAIPINGRSYLVVGIMPPDFDFPAGSELWTPLPPDRWTRPRTAHFVKVLGRLRPGLSMEQAQRRMDAVASRLAEQYPDSNRDQGIQVLPLHQDLIGEVRPALLILLGAVGLVLLIVCANIANLELARSTARQPEIAVRVALGASRPRLIRQLLAESLLLAATGGVLGLCLAAGALEGLSALSPVELPREENVGFDARVLGISLVVSLLTGLLFGLIPALQTSRPVFDSLRAGRTGDTGGRSGRFLRSSLVVAEVALALVLLISAGLLIRSFSEITEVDPGFEPNDVLVFRLSLPATKYPEAPQIATFCERLLERLVSLPQVERAGITNALPLTEEAGGTNFLPEGRTVPLLEQPLANYIFVSPGYFAALGAPLLDGRDFGPRDREDTAPVVIVNQALARRYWSDRSAVGNRITTGLGEQTYEIVGVVQNIREEGLAVEQRPALYLPLRQNLARSVVVLVRTAGSPLVLADSIRQEVLTIDSEQPIFGIQTLDEHLGNVLAQRRFSMLLISLFAGAALTLSALGIYGVLAYSVNQRVREIGIRMALGAKPFQIETLVVRQGLSLAALGAVAGLVASLSLSRLLSALLFGVSGTDLATFTSVPVLLLGVGLLATYLPARRAAQTPPGVVLKGE